MENEANLVLSSLGLSRREIFVHTSTDVCWQILRKEGDHSVEKQIRIGHINLWNNHAWVMANFWDEYVLVEKNDDLTKMCLIFRRYTDYWEWEIENENSFFLKSKRCEKECGKGQSHWFLFIRIEKFTHYFFHLKISQNHKFLGTWGVFCAYNFLLQI